MVGRRHLLTAALAAGAGAGLGWWRRWPSAPAEPLVTPTPSVAAPTPSTAGEVVVSPPEPPPEPPSPPTAEPTSAPAAFAAVVLCREAWGAVAPRPPGASHAPGRLTLHHSGVVLGDNARSPARLRQHQRHHLANGFSDIAYHLGVDRNGNLYALRDPAVPGETFTDYDPTGHFLVLAEGDFDAQAPSDAQLEGIAQAFALAAARHAIRPDTITGHLDHAQTTCPGAALQSRLAELRARTAELLAVPFEEQLLCGDAGRARVAEIERGER